MPIPEFGAPGPAQSEELIHFVHRGRPGGSGGSSPGVPAEIQAMNAEQRLDAILTSGWQLGFPPHHRLPAGSTRPPLGPCVSYCEAPPDHLAHLITERDYQPWGVILTRGQMLAAGGGAVAYVGDDVYNRFFEAGLGAWAVRTSADSQWMHEREWRLPLPPGSDRVGLTYLAGILIGRQDWRPTMVDTGYWQSRESGDAVYGPGEDPLAEEVEDYPGLWRSTPIWVWNWTTRRVDIHPPGTLT